MSLDAKDKQVYDLLNDKLFIIPENQRKYVWDINNWKELFDDILLVSTEKVGNHFIGSVVLKAGKVEEGIKSYVIIDGQQRISTLTIIFCVIAYIYAENGEVERFNGLKKSLFAMDSKGKYQPMISKNANKDIDRITSSLYSESFFKEGTKVPSLPFNAFLLQNKLSKNIKDCYSYFYDSLHNFINNDMNELEKIQKVINSISYIDIVAKEDEDAYTIFEILNARGKPLTDFELLRNFLLKYSSKEYKASLLNKLSTIDDLLGDSVEIFLKHYAIHKYGDKTDNKENRPYKIITRNEKTNDKSLLLEDLLLKAGYYHKIITCENCDNVELKIFRFFKQRRQQQFRPLVLGLMHQKSLNNIDNEKYHQTLNYLYSYFICYNVIGEQTSNKIDDTVKKYSKALEQNFNDSVIDNMEKSMLDRMPSQDHLVKMIQNIKYSNKIKAYSGSKNADNVRVIFDVIERKHGNLEDLPSTSFTIEHCYPDSDENETNCLIGNLMLLEKDLNQKCKDKILSEKAAYYKESKLMCPHLLIDDLVDSSFNIYERSKEIATEIFEYIQELKPL